MTVRWSNRARKDLLGIAGEIAKDNPNAAADWLDEVDDHVVSTAGTLPHLGRVVPELKRKDLRETFLRRRYRIVYRIDGEEVVVVTIFDGHQLWASIELDPDDD